MREYEIRILRADHTTAAIVEIIHLNDAGAIRAAKKIAEARPFEVWHDLDYNYGGGSVNPSPYSSPPLPAV